MSRIMMTCPQTAQIVPTGHRSTEIKLGEGTIVRSFRCSVCAQIHSWTASDAHLEDATSRADYRAGLCGSRDWT